MPKIENTKWKIGKPYDSRRVEITTDNPGGVETLVAVCEPRHAPLIATAPGLLVSVSDLLDIIHDSMTHESQRHHAETLDAARANLAKATGRA